MFKTVPAEMEGKAHLAAAPEFPPRGTPVRRARPIPEAADQAARLALLVVGGRETAAARVHTCKRSYQVQAPHTHTLSALLALPERHPPRLHRTLAARAGLESSSSKNTIWRDAVVSKKPQLEGTKKWISKLLDGALPEIGAQLSRAIWRGASGVILGGGAASALRWLLDYVTG